MYCKMSFGNAAMPISVSCHGCRKILRISDDVAGKRFRCNACGSILVAPSPESGNRSSVSGAPANEQTRIERIRRTHGGNNNTLMQRKKSTPGSDSTYSPVEADCNEITQQDEAEWDQVSQHRPPTQQRRPKIPKHLSRVVIGLAIILLCSFAIPFAVLTARSIRWSAADTILKEGQLVHATTHYFSYWGRRNDFLILRAGGYTTRDVCLLHPADAIVGTLQHGIDEAFVPAVGIKASNYSKSADIPRHEPRTADDLFDP